MIYAYLFGLLACVTVGAGGGYLMGRYQRDLVEQVKKLQHKEPEPFIEKPTITMGDYDAPRSISNTDPNKTFGIVQTKTPELLDWEAKQAIEKQVLGR